MPLTDEEVKQALFSNNSSSSPNTSTMSDEDVRNYLFSNNKNTQIQSPLEIPTIEQSPVSLLKKAQVSFAADMPNKVRLLKEDFKFVRPQEDGSILVGNDINNLKNVRSEDLLGDFLGTVADNASTIPSIAGQIALTGMAPGATIPALIARSAIGSAGGELAGKLTAKATGISNEKAEEIATDTALAGMFGAFGEVATQALKGTAKVALPKIGALFDNAIRNSDNPGMTKQAMASVVNIASGIQPEDFIEGSNVGFNNLFTKENLNPRHILNIVGSAKEELSKANRVAQAEVSAADQALLQKANPVDGINTKDAHAYMVQELKNQGMLDEFGNIRPESFLSKDMPFFRKLNKELGGKEITIKDTGLTKFSEPLENIPLRNAIITRKAARSAYDDLNPKLQYIAVNTLDGSEDGTIKGLQKSIREAADNAGVKEFSQAYDKFSNFRGTISALKQAGLDINNPISIENTLTNIRSKNQTTQALVADLAKQIGSDFYEKSRNFDLAQNFSKVNSNYFRLGAIAGLAGATIGGGDLQNRALRGGTIFALSNPATVRFGLKSGEKIAQKLGKIVNAARNPKMSGRSVEGASSVILRKLIESKTSESQVREK